MCGWWLLVNVSLVASSFLNVEMFHPQTEHVPSQQCPCGCLMRINSGFSGGSIRLVLSPPPPSDHHQKEESIGENLCSLSPVFFIGTSDNRIRVARPPNTNQPTISPRITGMCLCVCVCDLPRCCTTHAEGTDKRRTDKRTLLFQPNHLPSLCQF